VARSAVVVADNTEPDQADDVGLRTGDRSGPELTTSIL
jgi:hypothetical protein